MTASSSNGGGSRKLRAVHLQTKCEAESELGVVPASSDWLSIAMVHLSCFHKLLYQLRTECSNIRAFAGMGHFSLKLSHLMMESTFCPNHDVSTVFLNPNTV